MCLTYSSGADVQISKRECTHQERQTGWLRSRKVRGRWSFILFSRRSRRNRRRGRYLVGIEKIKAFWLLYFWSCFLTSLFSHLYKNYTCASEPMHVLLCHGSFQKYMIILSTSKKTLGGAFLFIFEHKQTVVKVKSHEIIRIENIGLSLAN